jgi:hypothetical protein
MGDHDHSYKLLFAHSRMVRELLETFVGGDWVAEVDLDSLERVSDSYISDDLRARADEWCGAFAAGIVTCTCLSNSSRESTLSWRYA